MLVVASAGRFALHDVSGTEVVIRAEIKAVSFAATNEISVIRVSRPSIFRYFQSRGCEVLLVGRRDVADFNLVGKTSVSCLVTDQFETWFGRTRIDVRLGKRRRDNNIMSAFTNLLASKILRSSSQYPIGCSATWRRRLLTTEATPPKRCSKSDSS
jgi:hypothetical protein